MLAVDGLDSDIRTSTIWTAWLMRWVETSLGPIILWIKRESYQKGTQLGFINSSREYMIGVVKYSRNSPPFDFFVNWDAWQRVWGCLRLLAHFKFWCFFVVLLFAIGLKSTVLFLILVYYFEIYIFLFVS